MKFIQLQRLELESAYLESYYNAGGLYLFIEHIEALVPCQKSFRENPNSNLKKVFATEIHMRSGKKYLVPYDITYMLEMINV